jgi:crotonobetainyl-CoA:carnitine CoA-transferase CaiB-like acyl-CoA transferase
MEAVAADPRFSTNDARVRHREELVPQVAEAMKQKGLSTWLEAFNAQGIPAGPINDIGQAFEEKQAVFRKLAESIEGSDGISVPTVRSPLGLALTPPTLRMVPPRVGEHTREILKEVLALEDVAIDALASEPRTE